MTTGLNIDCVQTGSGPMLRMAGDLDFSSAPALHTALAALALAPGHVLTIDLAGLSFCDSTGITALIAARNHARAHGAALTLTRVPAPTLRVLTFVGLDQVLNIEPDSSAGQPETPGT